VQNARAETVKFRQSKAIKFENLGLPWATNGFVQFRLGHSVKKGLVGNVNALRTEHGGRG